jgi:hypothetical protein
LPGTGRSDWSCPTGRSPKTATAFPSSQQQLDRHLIDVVLRQVGLDEFGEVSDLAIRRPTRYRYAHSGSPPRPAVFSRIS